MITTLIRLGNIRMILNPINYLRLRYIGGQPALPEPPPAHGRATEPTPRQRRRVQPTMPGYPAGMPQTHIGMPGYPGHPPARPVVTRDPIVVWDPADRQR